MTTLFATYGSGNCFKPQLLMHQLGQPYRTCNVDVLKGETSGAAFRGLNPRGTVPFLVLEDGRTVAESNAMLLALGAESDLGPKNPYDLAKTVEWMIFEQTRLEPNISPARFFTTIVPERREEMSEQILDWQTAGTAGLKTLDAHLAEHPFIIGDAYSIADIAVFGYTHVANQGGFRLADFPAVSAWIERVQATPGFASMDEIWAQTDATPLEKWIAA